jgi:ribosomal protein S18 acetylase RimI-like enzyme
MQRITMDHRDAAAETLAQAFADDPLMHIAAPDPARRAAAAAWFMRMPLEYGLRWGEAWGTPDAAAVAVWMPPGSAVSSMRMMRLGMWAAPLRLGLGGARRIMAAFEATEAFHKHVHDPHWYLLVIGVRPDRQGQGLGSKLVEVGTSRADAAGVPCYLETTTESNVAFYGKRGFEVVGEAEVAGHRLWGMVRPVRTTETDAGASG